MTANDATPGERTVQLDIDLLGRKFKVACQEHERADLLEAVAFLDARLREIREVGKTAGVDRIAVMAALNLANELLRERKLRSTAAVETPEVDEAAVRRRILAMHAAIDQVLNGQEKLL